MAARAAAALPARSTRRVRPARRPFFPRPRGLRRGDARDCQQGAGEERRRSVPVPAGPAPHLAVRQAGLPLRLYEPRLHRPPIADGAGQLRQARVRDQRCNGCIRVLPTRPRVRPRSLQDAPSGGVACRNFGGEPSARVESTRRRGDNLNSVAPSRWCAAVPKPSGAVPHEGALRKPSACQRVVGEGRMSRAIGWRSELSLADPSGCGGADAVSGDRFHTTKLCRSRPPSERRAPALSAGQGSDDRCGGLAEPIKRFAGV